MRCKENLVNDTVVYLLNFLQQVAKFMFLNLKVHRSPRLYHNYTIISKICKLFYALLRYKKIYT